MATNPGRIAPGARLGPYEVLALLGAGGMGEVYRAGDTRLGRDVAIKVLPAGFASDPDRLRRFELEARAVAALDHPNILAIHDVGTHEGSPYLVTELLEGDTLRARLEAEGLTIRMAVEVGIQIAKGLAAAHGKGIIHRDLKPSNVFLTTDSQVKLLDFGVAKLTRPEPARGATTEASVSSTDTGRVMGTVGYMSPEQVRGMPADQRSDIFAFGCVLHEMLSGERPFRGDTTGDVMAAILKEDPAPLPARVPPALQGIVSRCLEKRPESRFSMAHDLALALEVASARSELSPVPVAAPPTRARRQLAIVACVIAFFAVAGAGLFLWGKLAGQTPVPSFKRITLRRGAVDSACFTPDFQSVVYSARWGGKPAELFVQRLASADARSLGVSDAVVVGTAAGDVAIRRVDGTRARTDGTLARLPLEGGTPRDLLKGIESATWDRNGTRFAVARVVNGHYRLEYPAGRVLFEAPGVAGIGSPRVSPDGDQVAFVLWSNAAYDRSGDICVVDRSGHMRTLSKGWAGTNDLAWSPDGNEVWFSATKRESTLALHAVTLGGDERLVMRVPGELVLRDIAPDGRVLVTCGPGSGFEMRGRLAWDATERDLSWLDVTMTPRLSPDGSQMLFQAGGEGRSLTGSAYHWRMETPTPVRLADGAPWDASPDWTTALIGVGLGEWELKLVPLGAGETRTLARGPIRTYVWGAWNPDGRRIVIFGTDGEGQWRLFVQDVAGGLPRPFARFETRWMDGPFSPDGRYFGERPNESAAVVLFPLDGGEPRPIPFLTAGDYPMVFSEDGDSLYVASSRWGGSFPVHVVRLNLQTGRREPWLEFAPPDRAGVGFRFGWRLTPNGRFYAYYYDRELSDLYLVEGLK
jgi:Tol biopolymer transport system component